MTPTALPSPIAATPPSMQAKPSPADRGPPPTPKRPFAEMLQQNRVEAMAPSPAAVLLPASTASPSEPADDDGAAANDGDARVPDKSSPLRPRVRHAGTATTTCSAPTEAESAATATSAANDEHGDDPERDGATLAAGAASVPPWRAAAAIAEAGRATPGRSGMRADARAEATGTAATTKSTDATATSPIDGGDGHDGRDARNRADRDHGDGRATNARAEAARGVSTSTAPQASPTPSTTPAEPAPLSGLPALHVSGDTAAAGTLAATPPTPTASPAEAAAATTLTLATPIDAPDFAAALGLQVSLLVEGGVQQAELHLNPTDLGPVSIHIALAGSEARIDFGADLAATRHAIEQGLPELAGALRDAGFTLAGGGVSQHAQDRRGGGDERRGGEGPITRRHGPRAASALDAPALARAARAAGAGGVDLYA